VKRQPHFIGTDLLIARFCLTVSMASMLVGTIFYACSFLPFFSNLMSCKQMPSETFLGLGFVTIVAFLTSLLFYSCHRSEAPEDFF